MAIDGLHGGEREVLAKIRYSHKGSPCIIRELPDGTVECGLKSRSVRSRRDRQLYFMKMNV